MTVGRGRIGGLILLAILGVGALVFHEPLAHFLSSLNRPARTQPGAATLAQSEGLVEIRYFQTTQFEGIPTGSFDVRLGDTLRTAAGARARLNFASGHSLELQADSQVTFEKQINGESLVLNLVRGSLQLLQEGAAGQLLVLENGFLRDPGGRFPKEPLRVQSATASQGAAIAVANPPAPVDESKVATDDNGSLSTDYIVSIIQGQKAFFNRCYANHLQTNPYSKGNMNFSFVIQPSGRVEEVKLLSSSINDLTLQKCVATVLERCRFRAFEAKPIIASYPIVFE